jgi:hypothetical protein
MCACCYGVVHTDNMRKPLIEVLRNHAIAAYRVMCSGEVTKNADAKSCPARPTAHAPADRRRAL